MMDKNRKTAFDVLFDMEKNQSFSNLALNRFIQKNKPDNPAFVRELTYGVVKYKIFLDYVLSSLIPSGLKKVKKTDLVLLRMGIYQLEFMHSVPGYAAVNESVKMARIFCRGREGFINGVMRGFLKKKDEIRLPDKEQNVVAYLSVRYSIARWIVERWIEYFGTAETERLLETSNETPRLSLRVNLLKTSAQELMGLLKQEGFQTEQGSHSDRVLLLCGKGTGILESHLYQEGYFSVQDEASVLAADTLHPQPGNVVIDICAAPGGKTMAMAEKMDSQGKIYAFDIYPHKLELMKHQALRLGIHNIIFQCQDGTEPRKELERIADCVLADVPCSGLGVIRRKPELKYSSERNLEQLLPLQQRILKNAASYVKKGGALVYSTCTIDPAENEEQIHQFLHEDEEFQLAEMNQLLPEDGTDGFFISKMIRI